VASITTDDKTELKRTVGYELQGDIGLKFAIAKAALGARLREANDTTQNFGDATIFRPVVTPESRLRSLAAWYAENASETGRSRIVHAQGLTDKKLAQAITDVAANAQVRPRALVFLEIPPGTPIVPMAAEQSDGTVRVFVRDIDLACRELELKRVPAYPEDLDPGDEKEKEKVTEYWSYFAANAKSSRAAMHVVERTLAGGGTCRWIDLRVPVGEATAATETLHLHLQGRGGFDTGDYAYRLLHRGRKHGLRLVGTLKSGPALDVLAVYEL